jgi:hypothetical protein
MQALTEVPLVFDTIADQLLKHFTQQFDCTIADS